MKHAVVRWNPATREHYWVRCGQTSDAISIADAQERLKKYDCIVPSVDATMPEPGTETVRLNRKNTNSAHSKGAKNYLKENGGMTFVRTSFARRWLVSMRSTEIGNELMKLLTQQTEFLSKTAPTPEELSEYERWRDRTRELFAELQQLAKAA